MGIRFEILFDHNPYGIYYTGQLVKGKAIIHLDEQIMIKGIKLRMRGYAKVRWDDESMAIKSDSKDKTVSGPYYRSNEERFIDSTTDCVLAEESLLALVPGTHTYTFECRLPKECPSTFEGSYGCIRYDTKIVIERSLLFNKSHAVELNVLKLFDLNRLPLLRIPVTMEELKYFCCGPCISKPLVLSVNLPKTGFVSGELVSFSVKVVNNSSVMVRQVRLVLNLIALYSEHQRIETFTQKIAIVKKEFGPFETDDFKINDAIRVPPTVTTSEGNCKIIKITYEIEVTAFYNGAHKSSVVSIPITIGNVPLIPNANHLSEDTIMQILRTRIGDKPQLKLDLDFPSPSYKEATYVKSLKSSIRNNNKFIPRYPSYSSS